MTANTIYEEKRELNLWESMLPEFSEEPVNKRYKALLDFGLIELN